MHNDDNTEDYDYTPDLYTLCNEDGIDTTFELILDAELHGIRYLAMRELSDDPSRLIKGDGGFCLFKIVHENGEEFFDLVSDEYELEEVSAFMETRFYEKYNQIFPDEEMDFSEEAFADDEAENPDKSDSDEVISETELDEFDRLIDSIALGRKPQDSPDHSHCHCCDDDSDD